MVESLVSWKRSTYLLSSLLVLQLILLYNSTNRTSIAGNIKSNSIFADWSPTAPELNKTATDDTSVGTLLPWNELPVGPDGEILDNLSDAQCQYAFPHQDSEIERAVAYWESREHRISADDTSIAWMHSRGDASVQGWGGLMRLLIHANQIRVIESIHLFDNIWLRTRGMQTLFLLHRAVESATAAGEILPTVEISLSMPDVTDMPDGNDTHTLWTWNRRLGNPGVERGHDRHWMMPNFDMWRGVGDFSYQDSRAAAKRRDAPFESKIPKLVWRGSAWVNMDIRGKLIDITHGKSWADVLKLDGGHEEHFLDNDELCQYAMTVHTEGVSYSGRMKWLTNCDSLIFFHEPSWDMYYYHLLRADGPDQNYVSVKSDWSDLEEKVHHYLDHPEEAKRIIANSIATFRDRYLTRAAVSCYTRQLIQGYARVAIEPAISRPSSDTIRTLRGTAYESFMMEMHDIGNEES